MDLTCSSNANFVSDSMLAEEEEEKNRIAHENSNDPYYVGKNTSAYMGQAKDVSVANDEDDGEVGDDGDEIVLN